MPVKAKISAVVLSCTNNHALPHTQQRIASQPHSSTPFYLRPVLQGEFYISNVSGTAMELTL
jgi:hypothetical protein